MQWAGVASQKMQQQENACNNTILHATGTCCNAFHTGAKLLKRFLFFACGATTKKCNNEKLHAITTEDVIALQFRVVACNFLLLPCVGLCRQPGHTLLLPLVIALSNGQGQRQVGVAVVLGQIGRCAESDAAKIIRWKATRQSFHTPAVQLHHFSLSPLLSNMLSAQEASWLLVSCCCRAHHIRQMNRHLLRHVHCWRATPGSQSYFRTVGSLCRPRC